MEPAPLLGQPEGLRQACMYSRVLGGCSILERGTHVEVLIEHKNLKWSPCQQLFTTHLESANLHVFVEVKTGYLPHYVIFSVVNSVVNTFDHFSNVW